MHTDTELLEFVLTAYNTSRDEIEDMIKESDANEKLELEWEIKNGKIERDQA